MVSSSPRSIGSVALSRPAGRLAALTGLVVLTLVGASACDDADGPDEPGPTTTPDGLTTPGSELELGQPAVVPTSEGDGVAELTIERVDAGTAQDLQQLGVTDFSEFGGRAPTLYLLRLQIDWVSGARPVLLDAKHVNLWSGDELVDPLPPGVLGDTSPCASGGFDDSAGPGASVKSCMAFVQAPDAEPADRITFSSGAEGGYWPPDDAELTWPLP